MRTIALISQKGGSGKTTLAVHLAVAAAATQKVAIIDIDPQASATEWSDYREAELPVVRAVPATRLPQEIKQVKDAGYQLLIIDTAAYADSAALQAAKFADIILMPCRATILDMRTITGTLKRTLEFIQAQNTPIYVVMNAVASQGQEAENAARSIAKLGVSVCPIRLGHRVAFFRSLVAGKSAQEYAPSDKASQEIKKLYAFVCKQLKASTNK